MTLLETVNLSKQIDGQNILTGINLAVEAGKVFALIGPTGAGKTTLLRLLNLLDPPTSGTISFHGVDTATSNGNRLETRRRMAFVLQKPAVFNMTVYDNIAIGLKWRGLSRRETISRVNDALEMVSLEDYRNRDALTLSGGETQRVAIARAVVSRPELLLLDEPTANLDPAAAARVEALVAGIIRHHNTTIIMATHDMAQGQRLADRVAVLLNGRIVQSGDWRQIFNSPHNQEVAGLVGVENVITGTVARNRDSIVDIRVADCLVQAVADYPAGTEVCVCIRPEDIVLAKTRFSSSARNSFAGEISRLVSFGVLSRVELDCGFPLVALVTRQSAEEMDLEPGVRLYASFKATAVHIILSDKG